MLFLDNMDSRNLKRVLGDIICFCVYCIGSKNLKIEGVT